MGFLLERRQQRHVPFLQLFSQLWAPHAEISAVPVGQRLSSHPVEHFGGHGHAVHIRRSKLGVADYAWPEDRYVGAQATEGLPGQLVVAKGCFGSKAPAAWRTGELADWNGKAVGERDEPVVTYLALKVAVQR